LPFRGFPPRRLLPRFRGPPLMPLEPRWLIDFRDPFGEDPLEPTLLDPLLGFAPPGHWFRRPPRALSRRGPFLRLAPPVLERRGSTTLQGLFCDGPRSPLSRCTSPHGFSDLVLISVSLGHCFPLDYSFSSAVPSPKGGFQLLRGGKCPTGVRQGLDVGPGNS
jgi:hypothetical protein